MLWDELYLARAIPLEIVAEALRQAFDVASHQVLVVAGLPDRQPGSSIRLLGATAHQGGQFPVRLSIQVLDPTLATREHRVVTGDICRLCGCNALVSDESSDPYTMVLVGVDGSRRPVRLDARRLEEREECWIAGESGVPLHHEVHPRRAGRLIDDSELKSALDFLVERSTPLLSETPEQTAALDRLRRAAEAALNADDATSVDRDGLERLAAAVRGLWTQGEEPPSGSYPQCLLALVDEVIAKLRAV